jgi:D-3-phosphoglycerate dehydrogenase
MKILITDTMHPSLFDMLDERGWKYDYRPDYRREDIKAALPAYDGLVIRSKTFLDREMLVDAKQLRFIARAGAGLDLIDLNVVRELNIQVFHAGTGNRDAVAEHGIAMLLGLFNNILKADREVRQGTWDREGNRGIELMGKTVGLIGYGNNGTATAQRLSGFGCKVLAYDKYRDHYGDQYAEESDMKEIMEQADIISLHIPLTDQTRYLIDEGFIASCAKPFFLMNLSRGEIVKLDALVKGLDNGKVRGACLDVLENEKIGKLTAAQQQAFDYLCTSDKVVLTPHIGGWTHESYVRINEVLVKQIEE